MNTQDAVASKALETVVGVRRTADTSVALRLRYVGSPESSSDYADAVLVSNTALTLSVNGVADPNVGASGVLAFATYTTLGTLVDAINASGTWEAEIVAGLRSDSTGSSRLLARSTSTFRPYFSVNLAWDSSVTAGLDIAIEAQPADFSKALRADLYRVAFKRSRSLVNTNAGEATILTITEVTKDRSAVVRTIQVFNGADNTLLDTDSNGSMLPINAAWGNDILVRLTVAGGWVDTGAYLEAVGTRQG